MRPRVTSRSFAARVPPFVPSALNIQVVGHGSNAATLKRKALMSKLIASYKRKSGAVDQRPISSWRVFLRLGTRGLSRL